MAPTAAASIGIHQEYWFHQNEMLWLDDSSLCSFFFLFKNGDPKFNGPPSGDGFVFAASDKRFCIREKLGLPGNWWLYSTQTFIENCIATTTRCSNKTWKKKSVLKTTVQKSWARGNRKILRFTKFISNVHFRSLKLKNCLQYLVHRIVQV